MALQPFEGDLLDAKQTYIDQTGRPTPQFMVFWQKLIYALRGAINGLIQAQTDIIDLGTTATSLKAAPYVTIGNTASLDAERALVPTPGDLVGTDGGANSNYSLGLATTAVAAGTYGDATHVAQVTFDAKGRATGAVNVAIADAGSWIPAVDGSEPPNFITDGAGHLIVVAYG